jgi:hypothetical protein
MSERCADAGRGGFLVASEKPDEYSVVRAPGALPGASACSLGGRCAIPAQLGPAST